MHAANNCGALAVPEYLVQVLLLFRPIRGYHSNFTLLHCVQERLFRSARCCTRISSPLKYCTVYQYFRHTSLSLLLQSYTVNSIALTE
jgi:hypothetical protein